MNWKLIAAIGGPIVGLIGILFGPGIVPRTVTATRVRREREKRERIERDSVAVRQAKRNIDRVDQYFLRRQGAGNLTGAVITDLTEGRVPDFKHEPVQKVWTPLKEVMIALCKDRRHDDRSADEKMLESFKVRRDEFLVAVKKAYE